ncbi:MAG TPA: glycoside hydrolase family 3 C-terminal domain-containing protein, partial [Cyclobacteriaceae bacterium]
GIAKHNSCRAILVCCLCAGEHICPIILPAAGNSRQWIACKHVNAIYKRLLKEQFELGLFENPYVDPNRAAYLVGNASFQRKADLAQRKSIVLLQNKSLLPLPTAKDDSLRLFVMGINPKAFTPANWPKTKVTSGDYRKKGQSMPAINKNTNYAIIAVQVTNDSGPDFPFGGAIPEELNALAFSDMAKSKSWKMTPSLDEIQTIMKAIGAEKTILAISFRQPYVIDRESGMLDAGTILATFGVSDAALLDVISGKFKPVGKLPFALANSAKAIVDQQPDAPGYKKEDTLFPFGFGLSY